MKPTSRQGSRGAGLLWLGVFYVVSDCIASVRFASGVDLPDREEDGAAGGGGGASSSATGRGRGSSTTSIADSTKGSRAILIDKASLRFFKFGRGELVLLK